VCAVSQVLPVEDHLLHCQTNNHLLGWQQVCVLAAAALQEDSTSSGNAVAAAVLVV